MTKTIILSLGGSLIVPQQVDTAFLKVFTALVTQLSKQYRLVIFTGGGSVARTYQQAAHEINVKLNNEAQDWIGIKASLLNAELVRQLLIEHANATIITDPRVKLRWSKPIWIGAGWKPGRSTDCDAA
jgi:uridylate kinase